MIALRFSCAYDEIAAHAPATVSCAAFQRRMTIVPAVSSRVMTISPHSETVGIDGGMRYV